MLMVARDNGTQPYRYMATRPPHSSPSEEVAAFAETLKRVRERQGLSQEAAAANIGQTKQSWQAYENGQRQVVLRSDTQQRLATALGVTREDLLREHAAVLGEDPTVPVRPDEPRAFMLPVYGRARASSRSALVYDVTEPESVFDLSWLAPAKSGTLRVAGDSMTGYVESGQLVIYDKTRWPRREEGCVIETNSGELYIKLYEKQDDTKLYVRQLFPEATMEFDLADIRGVYAVRLRGD